MILEVAKLEIKPGHDSEFKMAFARAQLILTGMEGYVSHQLQKCIEKDSQYLLMVNWSTLENHTVGFRSSAQYQQWRELLHHFYNPYPQVEHYTCLYDGCAKVQI